LAWLANHLIRCGYEPDDEDVSDGRWTPDRIVELIRREFDVSFHRTQVGRLLRMLRFRCGRSVWELRPKMGRFDLQGANFRWWRGMDGRPNLEVLLPGSERWSTGRSPRSGMRMRRPPYVAGVG
jgi:hypothetical protein